MTTLILLLRVRGPGLTDERRIRKTIVTTTRLPLDDAMTENGVDTMMGMARIVREGQRPVMTTTTAGTARTAAMQDVTVTAIDAATDAIQDAAMIAGGTIDMMTITTMMTADVETNVAKTKDWIR